MVHGRHFVIVLFLLIGLASGFAGTTWAAETVDNGIYVELLKKYVHNGVVNYQGFKNEEGRLDEYLKVLEQTKTKGLPRNEQLAFYINAYNAWTIRLILSGYLGIKSIKDLGGLFSTPWNKEICRIDGQIMTLNDLEHKIIRPRFQDPRVHFAVNCASKSCPPLISEPYYGATLDQQLDASARAFISNPQRNRLEGKSLLVSKIFSWYESDFKDGVVNFFLKYAEGDLKTRLEAQKDQVKVQYLDYDWSLNGK